MGKKINSMETKENYEFNQLLYKCKMEVDDTESVYNFIHLMFFNRMPKAKVNRLLNFIDKAALDCESDRYLGVIDGNEYLVEMTALRGMYRGILTYGRQEDWKMTKGYQFR